MFHGLAIHETSGLKAQGQKRWTEDGFFLEPWPHALFRLPLAITA
jgi:hypothetical protein